MNWFWEMKSTWVHERWPASSETRCKMLPAPPRWIKTLNLDADMADFISCVSGDRWHKLYSLWSNLTEQAHHSSQPSGPWASGTPTAPQLSRRELCWLWKKRFQTPTDSSSFSQSVYDPTSLYFSSRPMAKVEVGEEGYYCFILVPITQSTRHFIY